MKSMFTRKFFISLFSLVFLLMSLTLGWFFFSNQDGLKAQGTARRPLIDAPTILFALRGLDTDSSHISLSELSERYCEGKVYVLKPIKALADSIFKCQNTKVLNQLSDFAKLAKSHILITDINHLHNRYTALAIDSIDYFKNPAQYPLSIVVDSLKFDYQKNISKFMHTGVTAITRNTGLMADKNGIDFIIEKVKPYFQDADWVHISNEVSFYDNCDYAYFVPNVYRFCSKERDFQAFIDLKVNIMELTGNHNLDFGVEGYRKTFEWYKTHKIGIFGGGLSMEEANSPLIITLKGGYQMAFLGFNESCPVAECGRVGRPQGANLYQSEKAHKAIAELKKNPKIAYIVASVQFNEVDSYSPTPNQNRISRELLDFGADCVYGSQAHQVQKIEFYKNKPIFHGLGNFLFDQIHRIGVKQGYFLEHYLYKGRIIQSKLVYTMISEGRRPEIANPEDAKVIKEIVFDDELVYR
jgi:hypothetical protein